MVLPSGVNKATGLRAACKELGLSPHNVVGVGDAENDFAFLELCGCAVAVANALPMLKQAADITTDGARGEGVAELAHRMIKTDLAELSALPRQQTVIGRRSNGSDLVLRPRENLLLVGSSGAGKAVIADQIASALARRRFQTCIIDPEGDHRGNKDALVLDGGETIKAEGALDARGAANLAMLELLYETRVERLIRTKAPHKLDRPLLIDATIEQNLGFSYIQAFPLSEDRLRIAKVLVSERSQPDEAADARLDQYLTLRGWKTAKLVASNASARPLPFGGDFSAFWRIGGARVAKLGLRGGFVHPFTGRAIGDAAETALLLASQRDFSGNALHDLFEDEARHLWKQREFLRSVTAALADAAPEERSALLERLYRLDQDTLRQLQAAEPGLIDRWRIRKALRR